MLKRLIFVALLLGAIVAALLLYVRQENGISYITAPVKRGDILNMITVTGSVSPVGEVKVGSQISGQLSERLADYNQEVKKGQILARLDSTIFAANVREAQSMVEVAETDVLIKEAGTTKAEAELENARGRLAVSEARTGNARAIYEEAESDFQRKKTLSISGIISTSQLDEARAQFQSSVATLHAEELEQLVWSSAILSAEAELRMSSAQVLYAKGIVRQRQAGLDRAEVEMERTVIRAPIDGIVIGLDVETGQTVAAALEAPTLFTLAKDLRQVEVKAIIDEADIGRVHLEQAVSFTVAAHGSRKFKGAITEIRKAPKKVENVVTYTVLISADNADLTLFPGMTATIRIVVESVQGVLRVPNAALRFRLPNESAEQLRSRKEFENSGTAGSALVWVLDGNGKPSPLQIRTGAMDGLTSELLDGPLTEDQLLVVGFESLPRSLFGISLGR
jgi:HlyD family secretion protein